MWFNRWSMAKEFGSKQCRITRNVAIGLLFVLKIKNQALKIKSYKFTIIYSVCNSNKKCPHFTMSRNIFERPKPSTAKYPIYLQYVKISLTDFRLKWSVPHIFKYLYIKHWRQMIKLIKKFKKQKKILTINLTVYCWKWLTYTQAYHYKSRIRRRIRNP